MKPDHEGEDRSESGGETVKTGRAGEMESKTGRRREKLPVKRA